MDEPDFARMSERDVYNFVEEDLQRCMEPYWRRMWWEEAGFFGRTPWQMLRDGSYRELWLYARAMGQPYETDLTEIDREPD